MNFLTLVALLYEHEAGNLTDAQETKLFRELRDSPEVWAKLNPEFQARVLAKLESVT